MRYAASVLFSYTQTNTIEKEIPNLIKAIKIPNLTDDEKANIIIKQMNILIEEQCTTLEKLIPTKSFSNLQGKTQKKALDLLKFIELYFNNNTSIIKVPSRKKITIEHIMPQISNDSPSTYGFLSLQEQKAFLNNIGNLTLLYSDENTAAGNKKFNDKIAIYKQTEFYITKTIVSDVKTGIKNGVTTSRVNLMNEYQPSYIKNNRAFWDKTAIDNRGKNIAKLLADLLTEKI